MIKQKYFSIFFIAWFCIILFLSVIPDNSPDTLKIDIYEFRLDYLKHFVVYTPLGFSFMIARPKSALYMAVIGLFVATFPEFIQHFLSYRTFNPIDLLSNMLGFAFGVGIYSLVKRKYKIVK